MFLCTQEEDKDMLQINMPCGIRRIDSMKIVKEQNLHSAIF